MSKKILIVDDEVDLTELLAMRLESHGYDVITAFDGLAGLHMVYDNLPDLIILDVMMPKVNGYTICGLLKNNDDYKSIPIIMLTARKQKEDKEFDSNSHPEVYMEKPFQPDELLRNISNLLANGL